MSLIKRGKTWTISFTKPNGERFRRSSGTKVKREALELHDKLKREAWEQKRLGIPSGKTWDDAALRWLESKEDIQSYNKYLAQLRWLQPHLGGKLLFDISSELISEIAEVKRKASSKSTANRFLSVIRGVLRMAATSKLKWLQTVPDIERYKEPRHRNRWLRQNEALKLLNELPVHQEVVVRLALATGLRQGNVLMLEWDEVDMERKTIFVPADKAKGGVAFSVPLNNDALILLETEKDKHPEFVFTYQGKPLKNANTRAWKKALKRCGIENFRWHDLRHTWASWQVQAGTPLPVLQEMGAWASSDMVQKYAHLSVEHLAPYANNVLLGEK